MALCTSNTFLTAAANLANHHLAHERSEDHQAEVDRYVAAAVAMVNESFACIQNVVHRNAQSNILEDLFR